MMTAVAAVVVAAVQASFGTILLAVVCHSEREKKSNSIYNLGMKHFCSSDEVTLNKMTSRIKQ
jgi:hypothetical protein